MTAEGTSAADWVSLQTAAARADRSPRTIHRWIRSRYVRSMLAKNRLFVIESDVMETEQALFDGLPPTIRHAGKENH